MITLRMDDETATHLACVLEALAFDSKNIHDALIAKDTAASIRLALKHAPLNKGITASYGND